MSKTMISRIFMLIALLFLALMWEGKQASSKRYDPLDLAGFEERQNRFSREIAMEERLGKK